MIKELSTNFEFINDDILLDTFSKPMVFNPDCEFIWDGDGWVGIDSSHRVMKDEDTIDRNIYKVLSKLYKNK